MDWDDVKLFLALMRTGTVRAAAERLQVSHSTVARRIDAMELRLSVKLFDRLSKGYVLTSAGEDMLQVAERVETELLGLERRVLGHDHKLSGRIRLSTVDALATNLLMPHLAKFSHKYPEIEMEVSASYETVNLDNREADVALRFARNPPDHLVGRRLLTFATASYASNDYVERVDLSDPALARWIGFGGHDTHPAWVKKSQFPTVPAWGQFVSLMVQLEACKVGMGIGMLPCFLADREPTLRRLSAPELNSNFELWVLTHRDTRTNARIRMFCDFIARAIKSQRALIEGVGDDKLGAHGRA